ncbi:unnamed protein product [Pylaiella littoralis]
MPVRLAPILRAPDREEARSSMHATQAMPPRGPAPGTDAKPVADLTMYVNLSACRHSVDLVRDMRDVHRVPCTVIDISSGANIPSWLKGTPSIVIGTNVYCGDTAFQLAESITVSREQEELPLSKGASSFADIVSGKGGKRSEKGCGLSDAFCQPTQISEEEAEQKYSSSVDDAMTRLLQGRG